MSATPRHVVHACPDCRLTFPSRQALLRHGALDHSPSLDGAWLTAQVVGPPHAADQPHLGGVDVADDASSAPAHRLAPPAAPRPAVATGPAGITWLLVAALMGVVALTVQAELVVALSLLMVAWACMPRRQRQVHPSRGDVRGESHAPEH